MYIHEAIKKAMKSGSALRRKTGEEFTLWSQVAILPTNTTDCCYIVTTVIEEGHRKCVHPGRRWNPLAEDLLADDWELITYFNSSDLTTVIR